MKKLFKVFFAGLLAVSLAACSTKEPVQLDLAKANENLQALTIGGFYTQGVSYLLEYGENGSMFGEMVDVYDFDMQEKINLDPTLLSEEVGAYSVRISETTPEMYAVLVPAEGKEEDVKKAMEDFTASRANDEFTALVEVADGVVLATVAKDAKNVIDTAKTSKQPLFGAMMPVDESMLEQAYGINPESVEEFLIMSPAMIVQASTYIIVKPAEGKMEEVKTSIDAYMAAQEEQWSTYLPNQYEIVKNRIAEEWEGYYIVVATEDNELVLNTIKESVK